MKKNKKKKVFTVLLIPEDGSSTFSFKIRGGFLLIGIILWVVGITLSIYVLSQHINYKIALQYNKYLINKNKKFAKEVIQAKQTIKRVSEIEKQMRDLLKLKSKKAIIKYTGFGGPSYIDTNLLEKYVKKDKDISMQAFDIAIKFINEESERNEKGFQEIVKYITKQRAKLAAVPSGWPVKGWITCGFGSRIDPFTGALSFHEGVDIANDEGTPVKATADGVVSFAGWERGYGYMVSINHGNGYTTRFGHLQRYIVSAGKHVKKGQIIGFLGNSGRSTAPHLHYEVRLNGVAVNPVKYLNKEVALK